MAQICANSAQPDRRARIARNDDEAEKPGAGFGPFGQGACLASRAGLRVSEDRAEPAESYSTSDDVDVGRPFG